MTVLLVEDDASLRAALRIALAGRGLSVRATGDGGEALRWLGEGGYDWLVTDFNMRPMDGVTLARRALELRPDVRSVLISADHEAEEASRGAVRRFFAKPVDAERLADYLLTDA